MNKTSAFEQILHGSVEMYRTQVSNYTNFYDGARVKIHPLLFDGTMNAKMHYLK